LLYYYQVTANLARCPQLQSLIEQLRQENELLKEWIKELEARLAQYENPHTPPSLRCGRNRKNDQNEGDRGKPGQKILVDGNSGHFGEGQGTLSFRS
jgi:hypothetical protein